MTATPEVDVPDTSTIRNPATGAVAGTVRWTDPADVPRIATGLRKAQKDWEARGAKGRAKVLALDDTRATPSERYDDGRDFVPTNKWVLFGHHFAAIAGPGPLVGPTLAAQFGYLPGTLWLIAGAALAGAAVVGSVDFSAGGTAAGSP